MLHRQKQSNNELLGVVIFETSPKDHTICVIKDRGGGGKGAGYRDFSHLKAIACA